MQKPILRVERIGNEGETVAVIDNFAPDPDTLRAKAQALAFADMRTNYPGIRVSVPPKYFAGLGAVILPTIRNLFDDRREPSIVASYYSLATTPPRDLALHQRVPHIDRPERNQLAIVHFLTDDDQGGTAFYRHRSTGYETITAARHDHYIATLMADFARHGEPEPGYIAGSTAIFEQILAVEPRYNRAIFFRCCQLHSALLANDRTFAARPAEGRLTAVSFVTLIEEEPAG